MGETGTECSGKATIQHHATDLLDPELAQDGVWISREICDSSVLANWLVYASAQRLAWFQTILSCASAR
jgi:hypothetical protein